MLTELLNFSIIENVFYQYISSDIKINDLFTLSDLICRNKLICVNYDELEKLRAISIYLKAWWIFITIEKVIDISIKNEINPLMMKSTQMFLLNHISFIERNLNELEIYFNKNNDSKEIISNFRHQLFIIKKPISIEVDEKLESYLDSFRNEIYCFKNIFVDMFSYLNNHKQYLRTFNFQQSEETASDSNNVMNFDGLSNIFKCVMKGKSGIGEIHKMCSKDRLKKTIAKHLKLSELRLTGLQCDIVKEIQDSFTIYRHFPLLNNRSNIFTTTCRNGHQLDNLTDCSVSSLEMDDEDIHDNNDYCNVVTILDIIDDNDKSHSNDDVIIDNKNKEESYSNEVTKMNINKNTSDHQSSNSTIVDLDQNEKEVSEINEDTSDISIEEDILESQSNVKNNMNTKMKEQEWQEKTDDKYKEKYQDLQLKELVVVIDRDSIVTYNDNNQSSISTTIDLDEQEKEVSDIDEKINTSIEEDILESQSNVINYIDTQIKEQDRNDRIIKENDKIQLKELMVVIDRESTIIINHCPQLKESKNKRKLSSTNSSISSTNPSDYMRVHKTTNDNVDKEINQLWIASSDESDDVINIEVSNKKKSKRQLLTTLSPSFIDRSAECSSNDIVQTPKIVKRKIKKHNINKKSDDFDDISINAPTMPTNVVTKIPSKATSNVVTKIPSNINISSSTTALNCRTLWTMEETFKIFKGVKEGRTWISIKDAYFRYSNRTNVQIKDRWRVVLKKPDLQKELQLLYDCQN